MRYKIVFDTSSDTRSSSRRYIMVASNALPSKIALLQQQGRVIYSVTVYPL